MAEKYCLLKNNHSYGKQVEVGRPGGKVAVCPDPAVAPFSEPQAGT